MPQRIKKKKHDLEAFFAIFCVLFVLLSFGGMNALVINLASFFALGFLCIYVYRDAFVEKNNPKEIEMPFWVWGFVLLWVYALIQSIPLGIQDLFRQKISKLLGQPVASSISVNPIQSLFKSNLLLIWLGISLYASWIERRKRWGIYALVAIGTINSLIGWGHYLSKSKEIFGFYAIDGGRALDGYFTAIVNANTAAAMMLMSIFISVSLIFSIDEKRWLWLLTLVINLSGLIACDSRSAWLMLALFMPAFLFFMRKESFFRYFLMYLCFAILGIFWVLSHFELGIGEEIKFKIWKDSLGYLKDYWLLGSGFGSFGSVWSQYQSFAMPHLWASHAENVFLQVFCENGILGVLGMMWFMFAIFYWGYQYLKSSHLIGVGLYLGIFAVVAQQLFDLGLDGAGLSIVLALAYGLLWSYVPVSFALKIKSKSLFVLMLLLLCYPLSLGFFYQSEGGMVLKKIYADGSYAYQKKWVTQELPYQPRNWLMVMAYTKKILVEKINQTGSSTDQNEISWGEVEKWIKVSQFLAPQQDLPYYLEAKAYLAQNLGDLAQPALYKAILLNPLKKKDYFKEVYHHHLNPWLSIPSREYQSYLFFLDEQQAWKASWQMIQGHIDAFDESGKIQAIKICGIAMDLNCLSILKSQMPTLKIQNYILGVESALKGDEALAISYINQSAQDEKDLKGKLKFISRLISRSRR